MLTLVLGIVYWTISSHILKKARFTCANGTMGLAQRAVYGSTHRKSDTPEHLCRIADLFDTTVYYIVFGVLTTRGRLLG